MLVAKLSNTARPLNTATIVDLFNRLEVHMGKLRCEEVATLRPEVGDIYFVDGAGGRISDCYSYAGASDSFIEPEFEAVLDRTHAGIPTVLRFVYHNKARGYRVVHYVLHGAKSGTEAAASRQEVQGRWVPDHAPGRPALEASKREDAGSGPSHQHRFSSHGQTLRHLHLRPKKEDPGPKDSVPLQEGKRQRNASGRSMYDDLCDKMKRQHLFMRDILFGPAKNGPEEEGCEIDEEYWKEKFQGALSELFSAEAGSARPSDRL